MKKLILTGVLMVFFLIPAQAQVLRNLKKKVEQRVEQKGYDKTASETDKSIGRGMQSQYNNSGFPMGTAQADLSEVPETYEFEWQYVMKMENEDGEMHLNYFLKKDAPYFGFKFPNSEEMFMVMDESRNLIVNYMSSNGTKMIIASRISKSALNETKDETKDENERDEYTFKKIDSKTIMGYKCRGFQAENKDGVYTFYITSEPDISFMDIYKSDKTKLPANFDSKWIEDGKGLMMQMILEDKKNAKKNLIMTCVALEKQSVILHKSDYKSLSGN